MPHKSNQKGFAAVEALLIVVIVALVGFVGYFVWHSNQQTNATLDAASKSAQSSPPKTTPKTTTSSTKTSTGAYLTITQWKVRAPYSGSLSLEYDFSTANSIQSVRFSSKQLDATDANCEQNKAGGDVTRYSSGDMYVIPDTGESSGKTAAEYAATLKSTDYGHVGNYYFFFTPSQGECGNSNASMQARQQTVSAVSALVSKLEALPQ